MKDLVCFKQRSMTKWFSILSSLALALIVLTGAANEFVHSIPNKNSIRLLVHEDPCEAAKPGIDAATNLSRNHVFSDAKKNIQQAAGDGREHSITFGRDANGNITLSPIVNGDTARGRVSSNWPYGFADLHNHRSNQPPSAGDLYYLVKINKTNTGYNTRFVVTVNNEVYALHIYDSKLADNFGINYPMEQTPGFSPRFPEPIFDHADKVSIYFEGKGLPRQIGQERALAFILASYKTGVALLKQDSTGAFKKLQTEEKTVNGVTTYVVSNCN